MEGTKTENMFATQFERKEGKYISMELARFARGSTKMLWTGAEVVGSTIRAIHYVRNPNGNLDATPGDAVYNGLSKHNKNKSYNRSITRQFALDHWRKVPFLGPRINDDDQLPMKYRKNKTVKELTKTE